MLTEPTPQDSLSKELMAKIDLILEAHDEDDTQIVGILLEIQELFEQHYVPEAAAYYIAEKLGMKISRIFDCLTFYSSLSEHPRAKYPIQICSSVVCQINQNETVFTALKHLLGIDIGEVTYDGRFTLESVPCFGACDAAPAVRINGKVYGHLDSTEKIEQLLKSLL